MNHEDTIDIDLGPEYREANQDKYFGLVVKQDGRYKPLCNFHARVIETITTTDGETEQSELVIAVTFRNTPPRQCQVTAAEFTAMSWPSKHWGAEAVIYPGNGTKDHIRTAIQILSPDKKLTTVHAATGWNADGKYIASDHAIDSDGRHHQPTHLPALLKRYTLDQPSTNNLLFTIQLPALSAKTNIGWMLLLAIARAPISPTDWVIHLHGGSGSYKTEIASLIASHWGRGINARNGTESWASTINSVEVIAHAASCAPLILDDFAPTQTAAHAARLHQDADRIIRAAGNQAGRSRLSDQMQHTAGKHPRCLLISTGEDIPTGESCRARMLNIDVTRGDVSSATLSYYQSARDTFAATTAAYIQWLAQQNIASVRRDLDNAAKHATTTAGHARTANAHAQLAFAGNLFAAFARHHGHELDTPAMHAAIASIAAEQIKLVETESHVARFIHAIQTLLQSGKIHVADSTGNAPQNPTRLGWTTSNQNHVVTYHPNGDRIGWTDGITIWIMPDIGYNLATRQARDNGEPIATTRQTLIKRMVEAGLITETDQIRQRNTVRKTLEARVQTVLAMRYDAIVEPDEDDDPPETPF